MVVINILIQESINASCGKGGSNDLKLSAIGDVINKTYSTLDNYYCTQFCPCAANWTGFPSSKTSNMTTGVKNFQYCVTYLQDYIDGTGLTKFMNYAISNSNYTSQQIADYNKAHPGEPGLPNSEGLK